VGAKTLTSVASIGFIIVYITGQTQAHMGLIGTSLTGASKVTWVWKTGIFKVKGQEAQTQTTV